MNEIKKASLPKGHYFSEFMLIIVAIIWGTTFTSIKMIVTPGYITNNPMTPNLLLFYRMLISVIVLAVINPAVIKNSKKKDYIIAAGLGFLLYLSDITQAVGLKYTTATKSAFIISFSLLLIAILSMLLEKHKPSPLLLICSVFAIIGMFFLMDPFSEGQMINKGDFISFLCMIIWSFYVVYLSIYSKEESKTRGLIFNQLLAMTVYCFLSCIFTKEKFYIPEIKVSAVLLYIAIVCTLLPTVLQTTYQRGTTSHRAALIFIAEPVFTAIFAYFLMHETLSAAQISGAAIIIISLICAEIFSY